MLNIFTKKIVWTFRRNKGYGVLNIAGLAIGIACAVLIFLWVEDELTYNHEFKNRDRLYKVMQTMTYSGKTNTFPASPPILAEHIQEEIPEVVNVFRSTWPNQAVVSTGDGKKTIETGYYCDPSFFSMLSVQFVKGNPENAFRDVSSIVLSEKTAGKFFPDDDPIGKTLQIDDGKIFTVTAVVREFPENVSYRFDWLIPFEMFHNEWANYGWTANSVETVVELHPSADVKAVNEKLVNMLNTHRGNDMIGAFLFNMNDWHLYSDFDDQGQAVGEKIKHIRIFSLIAFMIIILACIDFMNLSTAGSMKRAKEVGVYKAIGVRRFTLIRQFLSESMLLALISVMLGIIIALYVLPLFNQLVSKQISIDFLTPAHLLFFTGILLVCGLLSGAYPAFLLSSFKAVDVLKGLKIPGNKGVDGMRKTLVVFQFSVSICLMVCILVMYGQFLHTRDRDWGYQKEGVVTVPMHDDAMLNHSMALLQEVRSQGAVESAGISGNIFSTGYKRSDLQWQGKANNLELPVCIIDGITGVLSLMGIELEAGRDFSESQGLEQGNVIINLRMAQVMGEEGRVGGEIQMFDQNYRIIGITKDHIFNDYHAIRSEPLVMFCGLNQNRNYRMYIKIKDKANIASAMQSVEATFKPYLTKSFEYTILEDWVKRMIQGDLFMAKLLTSFGVVAILISCIGLLGLIALAAEQRTREIGIRKVFGARVSQIVLLLCKSYFKLVCLACIIAFPVAWWIMNQWLNNFENRMNLHWWIFVMAGFVAVLIAWCTVGVIAIKAATENPVKAIKNS